MDLLRLRPILHASCDIGSDFLFLTVLGRPDLKVMIVVNFFHSVVSPEGMMGAAEDYTKSLIDNFESVLDFGKPCDRYVLGIDAKKVSHIVDIHGKLEPILDELLNESPKIPEMCENLLHLIASSGASKPRIQFKFWHKSGQRLSLFRYYFGILESYSKLFPEWNRKKETFEAALKELHGSGQIVYFRLEEEAENQIVITDCGWFCQRLIGALLEPLSLRRGAASRNPKSWIWTVEEVTQILRSEEQCEETHLSRLIGYLEKLQLLYRIKSGGTSLLVPALLPESESRRKLTWPEVRSNSKESYKYLGRRLGCGDDEKTLLPFGVFSRLQVCLHDPENKSYNVGYCRICFSEGGVAVVIRYGEGVDEGEQDNRYRWEENQWVDIMVRHPAHLEEEALTIVQHTIKVIREICVGERGCAGVSLQESLMREEAVRMLNRVGSNIIPLPTFWKKVREKGFDWQDSWSDRVSITLSDLLTRSEIQKYLDDQRIALLQIADEFCRGSNGKPGFSRELDGRDRWNRANAYSGIPSTMSEEARVLYEEMQKLNEEMQKLKSSINLMQKEIMEELRDIRQGIGNVMEQMKVTVESILSRCSNQLVVQLLEGPLPAFPFLTDKGGRWQKLKNILGKELCLHLMCESPTGRHPINEQTGMQVMVSRPDWIISLAPVLVPALQVLCFGAKIAANVFLPVVPVFIPSPHWLTHLGVDVRALQQDYLKAFAEGAITEAQEKVHALGEVQKPDWMVLSELLKGKDVDMQRDFQLHRVQFDEKKIAWVCKNHIQKGRLLPKTNPFS